MSLRQAARLGVAVSLLLCVMVTGCGDDAEEPRSNGVEDERAVRGTVTEFYTAVLGTQDYERAAGLTADHFYLKREVVGGINIRRLEGESDAELDRRARAYLGRPDGDPRMTGPASKLAAHIANTRGDSYPFSYWKIDSVDINGTTAHVVTTDGSCGLVRVDGRWKLAWGIA